MKHLRINNRQGEFLKGSDWVVITEIIADDILNLARAAVSEDEFEWWNLDDDVLKQNIAFFQKEKITLNELEDFICKSEILCK